MDIERALVSKIISTGQLEEVISKGITAEMMLPMEDDGSREVMEWLVAFHRTYKSTPSMEAARDEFPGYEFEHVEDALNYVIDRMAQIVRKRHAKLILGSLADAITDKERSKEIELEFLEAAREIATLVPTTSVMRFSEMKPRIEQYESDEEEGITPGIPFGFPTLDKMTGGIQPHEFVTAAAFSGVGKSTLLRAIAFNQYSMPNDVVALYVSLEEEGRSILRKLDAMAVGMDYMRLKHLKLKPEEVDDWREKAEQVRRKINKRDILIVSKLSNCTPDKIYAETVKHAPDIVFIDYLSLMRSGQANKRTNSMWQNLTEITQDLKQNARTLGVPIIAAAQTNRSSSKEGADLDNIGYSLSVVQDSDIVIGLHSDDDLRAEHKMLMRVKKNREGPLGEIALVWNHEESDFREEGMTERFRKTRDRTGPAPVASRSTFSKKQRPTRPKKAAQSRPQRPTRGQPLKRPSRPTKKPTRPQRPIRS